MKSTASGKHYKCVGECVVNTGARGSSSTKLSPDRYEGGEGVGGWRILSTSS